MGLVNPCKNCGHAEAHHGPFSGRRVGTDDVIPGKLCYFSENLNWGYDLCSCPGFNTDCRFSFMDVVRIKAGGMKHDSQIGEHD